jgi:hypothetical protein
MTSVPEDHMPFISGSRARSLAAALLATAGLLVAAGPAAAAPGGDSRVALNGPVDVPPGTTVDDVFSLNGPVTVRGTVEGDAVALNGPVNVTGSVQGDLVALNGQATVADGAEVGGDVVFGDEQPLVASLDAIGGEVEPADWDPTGPPWAGVSDDLGWLGFAGGWLSVTLGALAVGLLFLRVAPGGAEAALKSALGRPGASIGYGAALFFGLPIAAALAMVTVIGIPLGVVMLLALVPLYALGYATSAWVLGKVVLKDRRKAVVAFLAGLAILRAVALVPVVGAVVGLAATVIGLGALLIALGRSRGGRTAARTPTPAGA